MNVTFVITETNDESVRLNVFSSKYEAEAFRQLYIDDMCKSDSRFIPSDDGYSVIDTEAKTSTDRYPLNFLQFDDYTLDSNKCIYV